MTTTPTAPQVTDPVFARGGRRGEQGRRRLADGQSEEAVTVLVVDDSAIFRRGMARAVEGHAGLELIGEADSGEAALGAIARLHPDVVLLDLRMPDLDGLAVLERLREAEPRPSCRVLIVSASLDDEVERAAGAAGAAGCIGKDSTRAEICAEARRLARQ
jgi:DNA-binding NarL/FixJ family response regulator